MRWPWFAGHVIRPDTVAAEQGQGLSYTSFLAYEAADMGLEMRCDYHVARGGVFRLESALPENNVKED